MAKTKKTIDLKQYQFLTQNFVACTQFVWHRNMSESEGREYKAYQELKATNEYKLYFQKQSSIHNTKRRLLKKQFSITSYVQ